MHDSAQALRGKKLLLVGFTLFSMFFGAGNLIFPPFLGAQAGTALWPGGSIPVSHRCSLYWSIYPSVPASRFPARPAPRLRC